MHVAILIIEDAIQLRLEVDDALESRFLLSRRQELAYKVSIFMQVVDDGIIAETLNSFLHRNVLIDDNFEAAAHLFIVDLVFLPGQFLLL